MTENTSLHRHLIESYTTIRIGIALLSLVLPLFLWLGGKIFWGIPLQDSISAYYHADEGALRNWFVGTLFAVGAGLYLYRGYSWQENIALDIAGAALIGVALVPMEWACKPDCALISWHGTFAVIFFIAAAYVCLFRAQDTLAVMLEQNKLNCHTRIRKFEALYRTYGVVLLASPVIAWALSSLADSGSPLKHLVFFVEAVGIAVFACYWLTKTFEIKDSHADDLAALDLLTVEPAKSTNILRRGTIELRSLK